MKTMKNPQKYRSYNQHQLKQLSDVVCDDIENLLNALEISSYKLLDKMVTMSCPIHGGDNDSAFNLYYTGDSYRGNWKCRTHQCESIFKPSIIGFIRGCLSAQNGWKNEGDPVVSFNEALQFAIKFTECDPSKFVLSKKHQEKNSFVSTVQQITTNVSNKSLGPTRHCVIKSLNIPSPYFLNRGFSADILTKYDVGDCIDDTKEMQHRAVVPVYDTDHKYMIGCTGRSIYDKCDLCSGYHDNTSDCPPDNLIWKYSKWKHNKNFKTQESLYNFWYAKKFIEQSTTVIIVESPGNVWRLEEAGIHNAVAIFGSSMSAKQKMLLDTSGAMNLITIMDNDHAGREASKNISLKCGRIYNIKDIVISTNDIAEMSIEQINKQLKPQLEGYL